MNAETTSQRNQRIAKNTMLLYVRMLITLGVSLYTVRIVLNTLGVEDYGLYNVVGGVVALLGFIPGSMASATQRFFSHALGERDQDKLNRIFGVNFLIYLGIGFLALVILKTGGLWFVKNHLEIPDGRYDAVVTLFYFAVITFVVSILKSPFMAIIIAHEDMRIYAYMAIADALFKLGIVFLLVKLSGDKIVVYGQLLLIVASINTAIYMLICFRKYAECRFKNIRWNRILAREIVGFTSWTLLGQLTSVARGAAITILLNQYFTPVVIAARAIAVNVAGQSNMLALQFNTSLYPPIIKTYAANQRDEMYSLVNNGCKATFFLMWILALPLLLELDSILTLWLKDLPAYTVDFARLTLFEALILAVSLPLATAARAPGKMAAYETILGSLQLSILVVSWFFVEADYGPQSVFYVAIAVNLIMFVVRLKIVSYLTGLPVLNYLKQTLTPVLLVVLVSLGVSWPLSLLFPDSFWFLPVSLATTLTICSISIYFLGLAPSMRLKLKEFIFKKIRTILFSVKNAALNK
jgi:O-antigen/teichoic acid export membrane protein